MINTSSVIDFLLFNCVRNIAHSGFYLYKNEFKMGKHKICETLKYFKYDDEYYACALSSNDLGDNLYSSVMLINPTVDMIIKATELLNFRKTFSKGEEIDVLRRRIKCDGELHDNKKTIYIHNDAYEYDYDLDTVTYIKDGDPNRRVKLNNLNCIELEPYIKQIQEILSDEDDWNSFVNQIY